MSPLAISMPTVPVVPSLVRPVLRALADHPVPPVEAARRPDTVELSPEAHAAADGEHGLTDEEQAEVDELERRDREVRAHEQAHLSAAGPYAQGGATFEYETGPNGKRYATGGHVNIDASEVKGDPQATIRKMEVVRRAALAPAQPSAQDMKVAAEAAQKMREAQSEQGREGDVTGVGMRLDVMA